MAKGGRRCPACGRLVSPRAHGCSSCTPVVWEPVIEVITDTDDDGEVVLTAPSRRWSRTAAALVGAAVVVAAIAVVGLNRGGTAAPPPATASTTAPSPVLPPGISASPPPFSESKALFGFLAAPTETILYGVGRGALLRIDLDRGAVTSRRLRGEDRTDPPVAVFGADNAAVLAGTDQTVLVGDGPAGAFTPVAGAGVVVFPSIDPRHIWTVRVTAANTQAAQLQQLDGSPAGPTLTVTDGTVLGDDGTGSLLVQTNDGVVRFDPDGASAQRVTGDTLVAWSASTLVVQRCEAQQTCSWDVIDRATGATRSLGRPPPGAVEDGAQLSPDGAWLACLVVDPGASAPTLDAIELASGNRAVLDPSVMMPPNRNANAAVWSPDGRWLFWLSDTGALQAWAAGSPGPVAVDNGGRIGSLVALARAA
jgi:hypothetical protein